MTHKIYPILLVLLFPFCSISQTVVATTPNENTVHPDAPPALDIDTVPQKGVVHATTTISRRRKLNEADDTKSQSSLSVKQQAFNDRLKQNSSNAPWKRVIYRQISLDSASNGVLYYPPRPTSNEQNLFTIMFNLINRGELKAYEYTDGLEVFDERTQIKFGEFLDRFGIYATNNGGNSPSDYKVEDADIPSELVKSYYIKEEYYFDPIRSTTDKRVIALCPIYYDDATGAETLHFPLFWVKYDDLRPFISTKTIMVSDLNNANNVTLDGFFRLGLYQGDIYKTLNLRGLTLAQYCPTPDSLRNEQQRIENQLKSFEASLWSRVARESIASEELAQQKPDNLSDNYEGKTARARRNKLYSTGNNKLTQPKAPKAPKAPKKLKTPKQQKPKQTSASGGRSARSRF